MKKYVAWILSLAISLSLFGCGNSNVNQDSNIDAAGDAASDAAWQPEREIRIICCYSAGGQSDLFARKLASIIEENKFLDTSLIIVNMAGGNTNDGINALTDADPDGYTLLFHHNAFITLNATGSVPTSYEEVDFVCEALEQPFLIVAREDSPYGSIEEVIADAKAGNTVPIGYSGFASPGHFALLNFLYQADIVDHVQQVTYAGGAEAITAQLGGQIDLRSSNTGDSFNYIASGDVKPLIFMSDSPHASYPDVETTADLGFGTALTLRSGLFAPKGTPENVIQAIAEAVEKACATEEWLDFCYEQGGASTYASAEEFRAKFDSDKETIDTLTEIFAEQFGG